MWLWKEQGENAQRKIPTIKNTLTAGAHKEHIRNNEHRAVRFHVNCMSIPSHNFEDSAIIPSLESFDSILVCMHEGLSAFSNTARHCSAENRFDVVVNQLIPL